jgi:hypothetical protein
MKTAVDLGGGLQSVIAVEDGKIITGTVQDCTAIMEHAIAKHNAGDFGSSDMKHAAKIPMEKVEEYCNFLGISFEEFMRDGCHIRAMCNNPDLKKFRIWPGRV